MRFSFGNLVRSGHHKIICAYAHVDRGVVWLLSEAWSRDRPAHSFDWVLRRVRLGKPKTASPPPHLSRMSSS